MPGEAVSVDRTAVSDHPASRSSERNVFDAVTRVASAREIERADAELDDDGIDPSWFDRPPEGGDEDIGTAVRSPRGSEPKPDYYAAEAMSDQDADHGHFDESNTAVKPNPLFAPPPGISRKRIELLHGASPRDTSPSLPPALGKPNETLRFPHEVKVPPVPKPPKRDLGPETLAWLGTEEDVVEASAERVEPSLLLPESEIVSGVASTPSGADSEPVATDAPPITTETRIGAAPGPRLPRQSSSPPPIPKLARQTFLSHVPPVAPVEAGAPAPEPTSQQTPVTGSQEPEEAERALFASAFAQTSDDASAVAGESIVPQNPAFESAMAPQSPVIPEMPSSEGAGAAEPAQQTASESAYQPESMMPPVAAEQAHYPQAAGEPVYQPGVTPSQDSAAPQTSAEAAPSPETYTPDAYVPQPPVIGDPSEMPEAAPLPEPEMLGGVEAARMEASMAMPDAQGQADGALGPYAPTRSGEIIVVFGCRGGAGATTIATNIAGQLAGTNREVCLLDFDLQLGDCLVALDVESDGAATVATLAREASDLDEAVLKRRMVRHGSGLFIASQAGKLEEIDASLPALMPQFLGRLRSCFDTIVVDGVRDFSEWSLAALDVADVIALVVSQDVASVRRACRVIEVCNKLGYDESKLRLVLNRHSRRSPVKVPEIERAMAMKVSSTIVNDYKSAVAAQNDGQLLVSAGKRKKIARDMLKVGEQLAADAARRHQVGGAL